MNELKFAFRQLLKHPGFAAVAVLTPALERLLSRSVGPGKSKLASGAEPPNDQPGWHDANHRAQSLRFCVEVGMAKKAADEVRYFILSDRQSDQTVPGMTQRTRGKSQIAREERRVGKCPQQRKNLLVGHAFAAQFNADLADRHIPAAQQLTLALEDVFVQDVHTPRLNRQFMGVFSEGLPGRAHRLRDGFLIDAVAPFFNDAFPGHSRRDLLQHVRHKNPRASKRRLPMANLRIGNDVTANDFLFHSAHEYAVLAAPSTQRVSEPVQFTGFSSESARLIR